MTGLPRPGRVVRHKYRGQSETEQPSYYKTEFSPFGGDDGDRTHDLRLAKPALYQLSYVPGASMLPTWAQSSVRDLGAVLTTQLAATTRPSLTALFNSPKSLTFLFK